MKLSLLNYAFEYYMNKSLSSLDIYKDINLVF